MSNKMINGALSKKTFTVPNVNAAPMPATAPPGIILNGEKAANFAPIDSSKEYPDVRSFNYKFGLLLPATNTSMEHELWNIIFMNPEVLKGIGIHTSNVITPSAKLATAEDLAEYGRHFMNGLKAAIDAAKLSQPQYLMMGMSLEHIIHGLENIRAPMQEIAKHADLGIATWHDAAPAALNKYNAKRIGLISPFDKQGNDNATRLFQDLGYEVIASVGFSCANAVHIAHIPDEAKEAAILQLLATKENRLDAIVQCGTNMSFSQVAEKLEPVIGIPVLGINAVTFWYALRENGIAGVIQGAGRLLKE